ncbi:asparagine synthase-related protein, partial [Burkholderia ambifaria]
AAVNLRFDDGSNEKYLVKKAFESVIPRSITTKSKHPYRAPDSAAFVDHRADYLELLLSENELKKVPHLDARFAQALTRKIFDSEPGRISTRENQTFIYLLSTAVLHRQYVRREGLPPMPLDRVDRVLSRVVDRRSAICS